MTTSSLEAITNPKDLLQALKDLKNSLIGNVPRKVDVARDGHTINLLLRQLSPSTQATAHPPLPSSSNQSPIYTLATLELITESSVILSSLASVGDLVLSPLLSHKAPEAIIQALQQLLPFTLIHHNQPSNKELLSSEQDRHLIQKTIPSLCKALRNILHAAGKVVFGHMTGVGVEVEVVGTGWWQDVGEGEDVVMRDGEGGGGMEEVSDEALRGLASASVEWLFERQNVAILLNLITSPRTGIPLTLLPVYQLFAQLSLLPSQRSILMSTTLPGLSSSSTPSPDPLQSFANILSSPTPTPTPTTTTTHIHSPTSPTFLPPPIPHVHPSPLITTVVQTVLSGKGNMKVKVAGLDFLSSLTRGERGAALEVFGALRDLASSDAPSGLLKPSSLVKGYEPLQPLVDMMESRTNGLTASAITCLANVIKALPTASAPTVTGRVGDSTSGNGAAVLLPVNVFPSLIYLLGQGLDERIRATFTLAQLISDSPELQARANGEECAKHVIEALKMGSFTDSDVKSNLNTLTRLWEGSFLCLAALALHDESSRTAIVDAGILPQLKAGLSHASYGLRASACQVVRAISRSSAILRTSLLDSGVSEETFKLLIDEEKRSGQRRQERLDDTTPTRRETVLVAATATICNLITEFSPVQTAMIDKGGIEVLVRLCHAASTPVRVNALWALRNMLYKNDMKIKRRVMECLGWKGLTQLGDAPAEVQEQAFAVLRNMISEATEEEIDFVWTGLGEANLFSFISYGLTLTTEPECLEQVLYVLYNLALGSKTHREAVLSRPPLLSAMSRTLNNDNPLVLVAALGAFSNLVESRDRHRRPRSDAVNKVRHLDIEPRLRQLTSDPIFDVRHEARHLLSHLEMPGSGR